MSDIEANLPETGLGRKELLDFVRLLPTNDALVMKEMIAAWVKEMADIGIEIDQGYVTRIYHDIDTDGRISHETVLGAEARPVVEL